MTAEERIGKKAELREKVEGLVKTYNDAVQNGKYDISYKVNEEITETVNEYTSIVRDECFETCASTDNPMIEAVKRLTFTSIGVKDSKVGDEKIPVREVIEKEREIDLLKLHKFVEGGIGADKKWHRIIEKINFLLTVQRAIDLGIKPKEINDSYAMSDIARDIDMGKTPTSKTNILKTVQAAVIAMLGEGYKATSHDVNYLLSVYSRKSSKQALTVTVATHKRLRGYFMDICNHIITGNPYNIDYKKSK